VTSEIKAIDEEQAHGLAGVSRLPGPTAIKTATKQI